MLTKSMLAQHKVQLALYACGFMFIFTETLLSPFYPQFFAKVFNLNDAYITGEFMAMCRLVVIFSAPLWGVLARYFDPVKLLIVGQVLAAALTASIAWVQNIQEFYVLTVFLLIFKSSYLLFYTLLIDLNQGKQQDPLSKTVGWVQVIMHSAIVSSTLVSAWVIQVDNPLDLFLYAAIIDVVQVLACIYVLMNRPKSVAKSIVSEAKDKAPINIGLVLSLVSIIFCFHLAVNAIRPFFTQFSQLQLNLTEFKSAIAYLLPSLMVLVAMPFIRRICTPEQIKKVMLISLSVLTVSSVLQFMAQDYTQLLLARCVLGMSLIMAMAAIDIFIFKVSDKRNLHFNYSLSIAVQNIALFIAPISAAGIVSQSSVEMPFVFSAAVYALCLIITVFAFINIKKTQHVSKEVVA